MRPDRQTLIRQLFDDYIALYSTRDERLIARLSTQFSGYASRSDRLVHTRSEWVAAILQDFALVPQHMRIEVLDLCLQDLAEDVVSATALVHVRGPDAGDTPAGQVPLARLVLVFRLEGAEWKIVHSGTSVPSGPVPAQASSSALARLQTEHRMLQAQLQESSRALAEAQQRIDAMDRTDSLTGLGNRRQFDHVLQQAWERAQRAATPVALVLLEVDALRHFMDRHGHLAADACLKTLALTFTQLLQERPGSLVTRFAGDAFALLLPGAGLDEAQGLAEAAVVAVRTLALPHEGTAMGRVSIGGGVAQMVPVRDQRQDELVRAASAALARARQLGGNRVESQPD